jgi:hypothetical protein
MFAGLSKPTQKLKNISLFTEGGRTVRETCSNKAVIQLLPPSQSSANVRYAWWRITHSGGGAVSVRAVGRAEESFHLKYRLMEGTMLL